MRWSLCWPRRRGVRCWDGRRVPRCIPIRRGRGGGWEEEEEEGREGGPYVSQAEEFRTFLRGAAYRPLEVEATGAAGGAAGGAAKKKEEGRTQPTAAAATAAAAAGEGTGRILFVMEEMPYHDSGRAATHFQAALSTFLSESIHPAIIMFTEEHEDRAGAGELERLLTRGFVQAQGVQQIHVNPVTDGRLEREGGGREGGRHL